MPSPLSQEKKTKPDVFLNKMKFECHRLIEHAYPSKKEKNDFYKILGNKIGIYHFSTCNEISKVLAARQYLVSKLYNEGMSLEEISLI